MNLAGVALSSVMRQRRDAGVLLGSRLVVFAFAFANVASSTREAARASPQILGVYGVPVCFSTGSGPLVGRVVNQRKVSWPGLAGGSPF